ncbi:UNVERIFIED_CONTAM: hypothetical protein K2H54_046301 [Gekko kuhli]
MQLNYVQSVPVRPSVLMVIKSVSGAHLEDSQSPGCIALLCGLGPAHRAGSQHFTLSLEGASKGYGHSAKGASNPSTGEKEADLTSSNKQGKHSPSLPLMAPLPWPQGQRFVRVIAQWAAPQRRHPVPFNIFPVFLQQQRQGGSGLEETSCGS